MKYYVKNSLKRGSPKKEVWILRQDEPDVGAWVCTAPADEGAGDPPGNPQWVNASELIGPPDWEKLAREAAEVIDSILEEGSHNYNWDIAFDIRNELKAAGALNELEE